MVASNTLPSIFLTDLSKVYRKTQECRVFLNNRKKFFIANLRDTLPNFHHGFPESTRSTDDLATRLQDLIVDASPPEYVNDDSSFGYDPSDDTLETSSAFYNDQGSYEKRDPAKFSYSRPKLLRLSADFPGVRNLEKMRRKRKSMGSSSTGSTSPTPSPSGEYGFFVALTSKDQVPQQTHGRYYSMT